MLSVAGVLPVMFGKESAGGASVGGQRLTRAGPLGGARSFRRMGAPMSCRYVMIYLLAVVEPTLTKESANQKHEYDLFISYHRRDMKIKIGRRKVDIIALFKTELERHLRPKSVVGPRWFKVCTDIDDFELGDTFDAIMSARISQSRKFLLVCSPHCAESPFVKQEVKLFLALKPDEKPLVAVFRQSAGAAFPDLVSDTVVVADLDQPDAATAPRMAKGASAREPQGGRLGLGHAAQRSLRPIPGATTRVSKSCPRCRRRGRDRLCRARHLSRRRSRLTSRERACAGA